MYSFESYASFRGFCSKSVKLVTAHNLLKTVTKSQITHKIIIQGVVPSKSKGNGKFGLLNPKYIPTNIFLWSRSKLALWRSLDDQYGERYLEKVFFFFFPILKKGFYLFGFCLFFWWQWANTLLRCCLFTTRPSPSGPLGTLNSNQVATRCLGQVATDTGLVQDERDIAGYRAGKVSLGGFICQSWAPPCSCRCLKLLTVWFVAARRAWTLRFDYSSGKLLLCPSWSRSALCSTAWE